MKHIKDSDAPCHFLVSAYKKMRSMIAFIANAVVVIRFKYVYCEELHIGRDMKLIGGRYQKIWRREADKRIWHTLRRLTTLVRCLNAHRVQTRKLPCNHTSDLGNQASELLTQEFFDVL